MVTITDRARRHVLQLIKDNSLGDVALRFSVGGGGCSGYNYELSFDAGQRDGDKVYDFGDLRVYVDKLSRPFIGNTQIDYEETLYGSGFSFTNPQASATCGCGQSFAADEPAVDS